MGSPDKKKPRAVKSDRDVVVEQALREEVNRLQSELIRLRSKFDASRSGVDCAMEQQSVPMLPPRKVSRAAVLTAELEELNRMIKRGQQDIVDLQNRLVNARADLSSAQLNHADVKAQLLHELTPPVAIQ